MYFHSACFLFIYVHTGRLRYVVVWSLVRQVVADSRRSSAAMVLQVALDAY